LVYQGTRLEVGGSPQEGIGLLPVVIITVHC